jgi:hypothetical protein
MALLEWLQELLSGIFLRRHRLPWYVLVLIGIAIFVLASFYIVPLIRAVQDLGGPDG